MKYILTFSIALAACTPSQSPQPQIEIIPQYLDGCPRVGGEYGHDGRWLVCYACVGESVVCVPTGMPQ